MITQQSLLKQFWNKAKSVSSKSGSMEEPRKALLKLAKQNPEWRQSVLDFLYENDPTSRKVMARSKGYTSKDIIGVVDSIWDNLGKSFRDVSLTKAVETGERSSKSLEDADKVVRDLVITKKKLLNTISSNPKRGKELLNEFLKNSDKVIDILEKDGGLRSSLKDSHKKLINQSKDLMSSLSNDKDKDKKTKGRMDSRKEFLKEMVPNPDNPSGPKIQFSTLMKKDPQKAKQELKRLMGK